MRILLPWGKKKKKPEDDPIRMAVREELALRDEDRKQKNTALVEERRKKKLFGGLPMARQRQLLRFLERKKSESNVKK